MIGTRIQSALGLSIALTVGTAHAASPTYYVEAGATTSYMPGSGSFYTGLLAGEVFAHALNDPPATEWTWNINQIVFSDAKAESWTEIGSLMTHAFASAHRVQATNFPRGVVAQPYAKFIDRLRVTSDTLPVGTPVYVTFGNVMNVDWQGTGLYDGTAKCSLQIGGYASFSQFSTGYNKETISSAAVPLVIKTSVGNTITLTGRLDTMAQASYSGPGFAGEMTIDAICDAPLLAVTPGVELVAESGVDYAAL